MLGLTPQEVGQIAVDPSVLPLASDNGGYLLLRLDALGRIYDLHALFRPKGWGRETHIAGIEAMDRIFASGAQIITIHEVEGNWRSRAPASFGFRPAGSMRPTAFGRMRTWVLSENGWRQSPAYRRSH